MDEKMDLEVLLMLKHKKRKKFWSRIVSVLMCLVVFCTTYALILPAITMEGDTFCGIEAHTHTEDCYNQTLLCQTHVHTDACYLRQGEQICELAESAGHTHTETCIPQTQMILTCGQEEVAAHSHTDECSCAEQVLSCGQEETLGHTHGEQCVTKSLQCTLPEDENHIHSDGCYVDTMICGQDEIPAHSHGDDCYTTVTTNLCGLEENAGHSHTDACYTPVTIYSCGMEESEAHTHTDACYEMTQEQICTIETDPEHEHTEACYDKQLVCELEEHEHSLPCYADPNADVETAANWEATLPELTGEYAGDVLAIAKSQLGYTESERNYIVSESGETKGYTRYGAWYGIPYGDWCAMFVSFCLDYAGVEDFPLDANCPNWISALTEKQMYAVAENYTPAAGDIIFFDWNDNELADHVGIVAEYIPATDTTAAQVKTIEGNAGNIVRYNTYNLADSTILGYGILPQKLTEEEEIQVNQVIAMIEAMPSADEIDAKVEEFAAAGDEEGEIAYLEAAYQQVAEVYYCYEQLPEALKRYVTNAEKLLELEYIWGDESGTTEHVHDESCYVQGTELVCQWMPHIHEEDCYLADGTLTCAINPEEVHSHTSECYEKVLKCTNSEDLAYCCGLQEHTHSEDCFTESGEQTCIREEHTHYARCVDPDAKPYCWLTEHTHAQTCKDISGTLLCTVDEHTHEIRCFDRILYLAEVIDNLPASEEAEKILENLAAEKDWDSYLSYKQKIKSVAQPVYEVYQELTDEGKNQILNYDRLLALSWLWNEPIYLCGLEEHSHNEDCVDDDGELVCGLTEHSHYVRCEDPGAEAYCWLTEHRHDASCVDDAGTLICSVEAHVHESRCFDEVLFLVVMIDTLPTAEEAETILLTFDENEDWVGYAVYQEKIADLAWPLYYACEELSEKELALVTNYDRLMELSWLWSMTTYAADLSKITYNPDYTTDDYHTQWETPGGWITESTDPRVHINEAVPDMYALDGLVIGAKSADSVTASFTPLFTEIPSNAEAEEVTTYTWDTLESTGMECTLGANLVLPSEAEPKKAVLDAGIYALYKNIGTYNDQEIDLKISLVDYENYVDWGNNKVAEGVLGFWTEDIRSDQPTCGQKVPGISVCGISWVRVLYTFFDSVTGEEINVKGSTSFYDLDFAQAVHIRAGETKLKGIYVTDANSSVPDLDAVNKLTSRNAQRNYFETWHVDDCVLKFSSVPPVTEKDNVMSGVVVYSPHGNDNGLNSEQYGDTKHAFTLAFERNNINIVYSFDKGKYALSGSASAEKPKYSRNANGGIIHSAVPVYTGSLEVQKEVSGAYANTDEEFQFQIEFFKSGSIIDESLDGKFGDVILVDGVGSFTLKHGEAVKLTGIPIRENGTLYKVTELTTDGYIVETTMADQVKDGNLTTYGPYYQDYYTSSIQADDVMAQHQIVIFNNYGGAVLPETGGTGTHMYTMAGLLLMLTSVAYLLYKWKRRGREVS